eukprot:TRINITY_DN448_c0_g1_i1.p1 TRINITY_DN448_c0_g1~~TRINITY_DN448_c0_g1_i1.p1  ORF type:complete len:1441 (-),score=306.31 TRINITY_DN448_c0_g1_i1:49-4371(-)
MKSRTKSFLSTKNIPGRKKRNAFIQGITVANLAAKGFQLSGDCKKKSSSGQWNNRYFVLDNSGKYLYYFPESEGHNKCLGAYNVKHCTVYASPTCGKENGLVLYDIRNDKELILSFNVLQQKDQWLNTLEKFLDPSIKDDIIPVSVRVDNSTGIIDIPLSVRGTVLELIAKLRNEWTNNVIVEDFVIFQVLDNRAIMLPPDAVVRDCTKKGHLLFQKHNRFITNSSGNVLKIERNDDIVRLASMQDIELPTNRLTHTSEHLFDIDLLNLEDETSILFKIYLPDGSRKTHQGNYHTTIYEIRTSVQKKVGPHALDWVIYEVKPFESTILQDSLIAGAIMEKWTNVDNPSINKFEFSAPPLLVDSLEDKTVLRIRLGDNTIKSVALEQNSTIGELVCLLKKKCGTLDTTTWRIYSVSGTTCTLHKDENIYIHSIKEKYGGEVQFLYKELDRSIYGISYDEIMYAHNFESGIPTFIEQLFEYIERHALNIEGIFRIPAPKGKLQSIKDRVNREIFYDVKSISDPHLACGLLKLFLLDLPNPLMTFELYREWMDVAATVNPAQGVRNILKKLKYHNYQCLKRILQLGVQILAFSDLNLMTPENLAIVLCPSILYDQNPDPISQLKDVQNANLVMVFLLENYSQIFEETVPIPALEDILPPPDPPLPSQLEENIIRIYLEDNTVKTLPLPSRNTTISELNVMIKRKMRQTDTEHWRIYEFKDGVENFLADEECVGDIRDLWADPSDQFRNRLVFKEIDIKLFGIPFDSLILIHDTIDGIPIFLSSCFDYLEEKALNIKGLFRFSEDRTIVELYRSRVDRGEYFDLASVPTDHTIPGLILLFLKVLPHPITTFHMYNDWLATDEIFQPREKIQSLKNLCVQLPKPHLGMLSRLMRLMYEVSQNSHYNDMDSNNLSLILSSILLYDEDPDPISSARDMVHKSGVIKFMIDNYKSIFLDIYPNKEYETSIQENETPQNANTPRPDNRFPSRNGIPGAINYTNTSGPPSRYTISETTRKPVNPLFSNLQEEGKTSEPAATPTPQRSASISVAKYRPVGAMGMGFQISKSDLGSITSRLKKVEKPQETPSDTQRSFGRPANVAPYSPLSTKSAPDIFTKTQYPSTPPPVTERTPPIVTERNAPVNQDTSSPETSPRITTLVSPRTNSPVTSPKTTSIAPETSPRTINPIVSPRTGSPATSPRTISPVVSPRTNSPIVSPNTTSRTPETPETLPRTINPAVSPRTGSPTASPSRTGSPAASPRTISPVASPRIGSPTAASPRTGSPVVSPRTISPVVSPRIGSPTSPRSGGPIRTLVRTNSTGVPVGRVGSPGVPRRSIRVSGKIIPKSRTKPLIKRASSARSPRLVTSPTKTSINNVNNSNTEQVNPTSTEPPFEVQAVENYSARVAKELDLTKDATYTVLRVGPRGKWYQGTNHLNEKGWFPIVYTKHL